MVKPTHWKAESQYTVYLSVFVLIVVNKQTLTVQLFISFGLRLRWPKTSAQY